MVVVYLAKLSEAGSKLSAGKVNAYSKDTRPKPKSGERLQFGAASRKKGKGSSLACETAVLLAGGRGTRLHPLTRFLPKPLVPLFGRPVLDYLLSHLVRCGVRRLHVLLGFESEQLRTHLLHEAPEGLALHFTYGNEPLGTAGAVRRLLCDLPERFLVVSGDALTNADLPSAFAFHLQQGATVTLLAKHVEDASQFGLLELTPDRRVAAFHEKPGRPSTGPPPAGAVNCGIYVLERRILEQVPPGVHFDFGRNLLPRLVAQRVPVYAWPVSGYWRDIGTWESYRAGFMDVLKNKVPLPEPKLAEKLFLLRRRLERGRLQLPPEHTRAIALLEAEFRRLAL